MIDCHDDCGFAQKRRLVATASQAQLMSVVCCLFPDPEAFERGNYMKILQTWKARSTP